MQNLNSLHAYSFNCFYRFSKNNLCPAFRSKDKWSVQSYEVKDVQFNYEDINNKNCIISKMATKMAPKNLNLMYDMYLCWDTLNSDF